MCKNTFLRAECDGEIVLGCLDLGLFFQIRLSEKAQKG